MSRTCLMTMGILLITAPVATANLIETTTGEATGWGLTPFTRPNQANVYDGSTWSTISNDYAPIDYPGGVGYRPSPGGSTGEGFDLEEMHLRVRDDLAQVLLVASSGPSARAAGHTWYLGDLFLTFGDRRFGIVAHDLHQGLAAGSVYRLEDPADVVGIQNHSRSYLGDGRLRANDYGPDATVADIVGALAVAGSIAPEKLVGTADIQQDVFDYGSDENGTLVTQFSLDAGLLDLQPGDTFSSKMTWGCGNDVIRIDGWTSPVPEPATLAMVAVGVVATYISRRKRARE